MYRKTLIAIWLFAFLIILTGCKISFGTKTANVNDGGVYKSADKGETWQAKILIPTTKGAPANISTVNISRIVFDPQDSQAIYLATNGGSLIYTYNGGEDWLLPRSQPTEMKVIEDVAIDSKDSCTLYVAAASKVYKSVNCCRSWQEAFSNTRVSDVTTALAADWYNPAIIYAGTSEGNIIQSTDGGVTWERLKSTNNKVKKIIIDPYDSRIVYVATDREGIFKTNNKGETWEQIKDALGKYNGGLEYKDLVFSQADRNSLVWAAQYGLLKTNDGGASWTPIKLVTGEKKANIFCLAVDPENSQGIYYATENTFYKSLDGGENWSSKKLPSTRAATALAIDPDDPKVLYLGFTRFGK